MKSPSSFCRAAGEGRAFFERRGAAVGGALRRARAFSIRGLTGGSARAPGALLEGGAFVDAGVDAGVGGGEGATGARSGAGAALIVTGGGARRPGELPMRKAAPAHSVISTKTAKPSR
jgi:hypothetical protein